MKFKNVIYEKINLGKFYIVTEERNGFIVWEDDNGTITIMMHSFDREAAIEYGVTLAFKKPGFDEAGFDADGFPEDGS